MAERVAVGRYVFLHRNTKALPTECADVVCWNEESGNQDVEDPTLPNDLVGKPHMPYNFLGPERQETRSASPNSWAILGISHLGHLFLLFGGTLGITCGSEEALKHCV